MLTEMLNKTAAFKEGRIMIFDTDHSLMMSIITDYLTMRVIKDLSEESGQEQVKYGLQQICMFKYFPAAAFCKARDIIMLIWSHY